MTNKRRKQGKVGEDKDDLIRDVPKACADEVAAVAFLERLRWGDHPECPRCSSSEVRRILSRDGNHAPRFLWRCYDCKREKRAEQYTWRIASPAEDSRIPARAWVYALWRSTTSKKGVAALEIKRQTGLSYKSSLFLMHRIRYGMGIVSPGGKPAKEDRVKGTIEADETYVGGRPRNPTPGGQGPGDKAIVVGVLQRGGDIRLRAMTRVTTAKVGRFLKNFADPSSRLMTDESVYYKRHGKRFGGGHHTVNHNRREYARGDVTTNSIEGAFSNLKRGLFGIWHSVSRAYLPLYLNEVEFRYNERHVPDGERLRAAVQGMQGKRLLFRSRRWRSLNLRLS